MTAKKELTRQRILEATHKGFREQGYDGAGIDGLASAAGVTSGAFYSHFGSKKKAFREVIAEGVQQFEAGLSSYQEKYGSDWLEEFASFYLGEKRTSELGESCALQSLTPEVMRSDDETKSVFQAELVKSEQTFSAGLNSPGDAWPLIAMLIGGATLARAVEDPKLADEISEAVANSLAGKA